MAFCYNCGKKIKDGSKFCIGCGFEQDEEIEEIFKRKQEYVGTIKKCPSCGEEIKSLTAICPACGHELNNKNVNQFLKKFIEQVTELENKTAGYSIKEKNGWSTWGKGTKIGWVILNIIFLCMPLVYYYMWKLITLGSAPKLGKNEKELYNFIQNYQFPNDRESILEALIFVKDKVNFIATDTQNKKTYYWTKVWANKARELKQKSDILFSNDEIVRKCYDDIKKKSQEMKKKLTIKTILIIVGVVLFFVCNNVSDSSTTNKVDYNNILELPTNGIVERLPKADYEYGDVIRDSTDNIHFEVYQVSEKDFEDYIKKCRNNGFIVNYTKTDQVFYAKDEKGYDLSIFFDEDKERMSVHLNSYNVTK